jgi:hypothetical protein
MLSLTVPAATASTIRRGTGPGTVERAAVVAAAAAMSAVGPVCRARRPSRGPEGRGGCSLCVSTAGHPAQGLSAIGEFDFIAHTLHTRCRTRHQIALGDRIGAGQMGFGLHRYGRLLSAFLQVRGF